jgi:hypothetical protein
MFVGIPIGESAGDSATSLYGDLGLNPSIIPSIKSSGKKSTSSHRCNFSKKLSNPSGIHLTGIVCRYTPIKLEMELFLSEKITDEKISLVILLLFADFLVVDGV